MTTSMPPPASSSSPDRLLDGAPSHALGEPVRGRVVEPSIDQLAARLQCANAFVILAMALNPVGWREQRSACVTALAQLRADLEQRVR